MKFSFLHVADIHLGRAFSGNFKNIKSTDIFSNAMKKVLENIFQSALSKHVDFVLVAGDTFDSDEADFASKLILKEFLNKLDFANIKVFVICGNHDNINSYSKTIFNYNENSNIKIIGLNTPSPCKLPVFNKENDLICSLHALSYNSPQFWEDPVKYFEKPLIEERSLFHIGLLHCDVNADKSSCYAPCSLNDLKDLNYDYFALGHIHLPASLEKNIVYSGTVQGRNSKETGIHGIRYIEVDSNNIVKNEFVQTDVIRYENLEIDVSNAPDLSSAFYLITDTLRDFLSSQKDICEAYILKLNITGKVAFYSQIDDSFYSVLFERINNEFNGKIFVSEVSNSLKPLIDLKLLAFDDGITGELYKTAVNEEAKNQLLEELNLQLKSVVSKCDFTEEEFLNFKNTVLESASNDCISICSDLYRGMNDE